MNIVKKIMIAILLVLAMFLLALVKLIVIPLLGTWALSWLISLIFHVTLSTTTKGIMFIVLVIINIISFSNDD